MTVISRTHQVPIKICPLFWKMIIIGCTAIIIVAVDRGNLEAFFESNSREITSNWPILGATRDQFSLYFTEIFKSRHPEPPWHTVGDAPCCQRLRFGSHIFVQTSSPVLRFN